MRRMKCRSPYHHWKPLVILLNGWWSLTVGITILYTSLVEVFLKHLLMDDPDTGNIATRFFKKKFHKFELITCFCSVVPIIGQIYALILSFAAICFDKKNFIIVIRNGKKSSTLRKFIIQKMQEKLD